MQLVVPSSIYRVTAAMDVSAAVKTPLGEAQQLLSHTILWLIVHACLHVLMLFFGSCDNYFHPNVQIPIGKTEVRNRSFRNFVAEYSWYLTQWIMDQIGNRKCH